MLEHLTTYKNNEVRFHPKIYSDCRVKGKKRKETEGEERKRKTKYKTEDNIGKYIFDSRQEFLSKMPKAEEMIAK